MRKWFTIAAVAFQGLVLATMATQREWVLRIGQTVWLRTAPIDPRDVFRGDYVRLSYEVSTVPQALLQDGLKHGRDKSVPFVYAVLKVRDDRRAELQYLTDEKPKSGLFIRGRAMDTWGNGLRVRYGLEAYFVQQGRGQEIERARSRDGIQVPLEMEVAVGSNGLAVLKNHRWTELGLGLDFERGRDERVAKAKLRLLNASDKPLAIVDLPGGQSFSLEPAVDSRREWRWVQADKPRPAAQDAHVRVLKPGEIHEIRIDLNDPAWHVVGTDGKAKPVRQIDDWSERFRLVYRPPSEDECRHLRDAALIWHGSLPSRAFNGRWIVD